MQKAEIIKALADLGRGAQARLATHLNVSAAQISKMLNTKRPLRADEVTKIERFFQIQDSDPTLYLRRRTRLHNPLTIGGRNQPAIDAGIFTLVPLWTINPQSGLGGGPMFIAKSQGDRQSAPAELRSKQSAFAVAAWDDSNSPYLVRGSILFITRDTGKDNQWHVFGRPSTANADELQGPVIALLLGRTSTGWRVVIGTDKKTLPFSEFPLAWQAAFTRQ